MDTLDAGLMQTLLSKLKQDDPKITDIMGYQKFGALYLMTPDQDLPVWMDGHIAGGVYLVRRSEVPQFQVLMKGITEDLVDNMTADWDVDSQEHYVFYRINTSGEPIRGLWFKEDADRANFLQSVRAAHEELILTAGRQSRQPPSVPKPALVKAPPPGIYVGATAIHSAPPTLSATAASVTTPPTPPQVAKAPPPMRHGQVEPRYDDYRQTPATEVPKEVEMASVNELYSLFGIDSSSMGPAISKARGLFPAPRSPPPRREVNQSDQYASGYHPAAASIASPPSVPAAANGWHPNANDAPMANGKIPEGADGEQVIQLRKQDLPRLIGIACQHILQLVEQNDDVIDAVWDQVLSELAK
eukprot:GEMP01009839.1.p1 GENE.GEMP01009839.1~~GEMP01009839.1.p1  ORF type:complete len:358 (+),score=76.62 GEMP01009839.1:3-1076(+)